MARTHILGIRNKSRYCSYGIILLCHSSFETQVFFLRLLFITYNIAPRLRNRKQCDQASKTQFELIRNETFWL